MQDFFKIRSFDPILIFIVIIAGLSCGRVYFFYDVVWDDNCWLLASYSSSNIEQFLNTGLYELRRVPNGIFLYYLFILHKLTDNAYLIWRSADITIQVLTPIFLYTFLKNLFKEMRILSFFAAISFVVFPLDNTLPYLTVIAYRIATLLTIISFYLTVLALEKDRPRPVFLIAAFVLSGLSHYVFMEITIVFEAARLFVIGYIFHTRYAERALLIKKSLLYWSSFLLLCIPLIVYKLMYKPYGMYEGIYKTDFLFFLNWSEHLKVVRLLLFQQWRYLKKYTAEVTVWSVLLGIVAVFVSYMVLRKLHDMRGKSGKIWQGTFAATFKAKRHPVWDFLLLAILFLIPPILLLEFANREIGLGFNSSHFNQVQIGYAIIAGAFLYFFFTAFSNSELKVKGARLFISALIGAGVFFNNLNLDLYLNASQRQSRFWESFVARFPSLPENATFLMDVRDYYYFDTADLDNSYDLELYLNLLYTKSDDPAQFRTYRVFTMEEFKLEMARDSCDNPQQGIMRRITHFGEDVLNPCEFIVVHYRNNELLVNQEILAKYPDVSYRNWADKPVPQLFASSNHYPLRNKLKGFVVQ